MKQDLSKSMGETDAFESTQVDQRTYYSRPYVKSIHEDGFFEHDQSIMQQSVYPIKPIYENAGKSAANRKGNKRRLICQQLSKKLSH